MLVVIFENGGEFPNSHRKISEFLLVNFTISFLLTFNHDISHAFLCQGVRLKYAANKSIERIMVQHSYFLVLATERVYRLIKMQLLPAD